MISNIKGYFTNLTPINITTLYAALILTITLVWNIVNAIMEKRSKLKISISANLNLTGIIGRGFIGPPTNILSIVVTNMSSFGLYVNKPMFQGTIIGPFSRKIDGCNGFYSTDFSGKEKNYPLNIKPKE